MKVGTQAEIDRLAPLTRVDGEDGQLWRVTIRCHGCQVTLNLDSEEEPDPVARGIAAGLAPFARGIVCEECARQAAEAEERAETAEKRRERLAASGLPDALRGFEFAEMDAEGGRRDPINAARAWASESDSKGLCLFGGVGVGKTRLAATAASQRLSRHAVSWVSMPILLAQLGAAFNDKARREAIAVLSGKGGLVLDDLDKVNPSEWARNQIFAAVDRRVQVGAPLLVTTNLAPSALGEKFGEPLMSRLVGYCRVLELPGKDQRLRFNFDGSEKRPAEGEYLADPEEGTNG